MVQLTSFGVWSWRTLCLVATALPGWAATWPDGPLRTSAQWIHDKSGNNVTMAGVNWPGAADTMLPEGLQYRSIGDIVDKIKGIGINTIRLTYAIQMIDEIYENGGQDITIKKSLASALGTENGTKVFNQILAHNPTFNERTTRLEVFDAVAAACAQKQIYVHLDNHISKAQWCCGSTDGNGWWEDTYFSTANWTRGLAYMARHGRAWPSLVSMSLRNELRDPTANAASRATYNWQTWYVNIKKGVAAIYDANPDVLIFLSGLNYDTTLKPVVQRTALTPGTEIFSTDDLGGAGTNNKIVLEIHNYENSASSCSSIQSSLQNAGFQAMMAGTAHPMPVLLTEFGFNMDATTYKGVYASCLAEYIPSIHAGWMLWVLAGSYYIRSGGQDFEETWGLMNHNWSDWRNAEYVEAQLKPMIQASLA